MTLPPSALARVVEHLETAMTCYRQRPLNAIEKSESMSRCIAEALALLRQCEASAGDYVVVPRVATEAMHKAAEREWDGRMSARSAGVWDAMLRAAEAEGEGG